MAHQTELAAGQPPVQNTKSDGQAGPPVMGLAVTAAPNTPTTAAGPNAALREAPPKPGEGVDPSHPARGRFQIANALDGRVIEACPDGSPRKHIAICGFASSSRHCIIERAKDPSWSIWGLNQLYRHIPRADRWFDIHHNWDQEVVPGTDHRQWARECGIPFYTLELQSDVPTSVRYPIERVIQYFEADYFTSTIPYMVALAIAEIDEMALPEIAAATRQAFSMQGEHDIVDVAAITRAIYGQYTIGVYGIDLVVGREYFHEKPCAEFWLGAAALGRGIRVDLPQETALCKQHQRYGTGPAQDQRIRREDIDKHTAHVTAQRDEALKQLYMMEGVLQSNQRWGELYDLRERGAKVE